MSSQIATPDEVRTIAKDSYIYAYAMIQNYKTMYKQVVNPTAPE